jgi:hypothetical protein
MYNYSALRIDKHLLLEHKEMTGITTQKRCLIYGNPFNLDHQLLRLERKRMYASINRRFGIQHSQATI